MVLMYEYCDRKRSAKRILCTFSSFIPWEGEMGGSLFGENPIILSGYKFGVQKEKNQLFSSFYLWFEPLSCLEIIKNGKGYHNGVFV